MKGFPFRPTRKDWERCRREIRQSLRREAGIRLIPRQTPPPAVSTLPGILDAGERGFCSNNNFHLKTIDKRTPMTAAQLIEILQSQPSEMEVRIWFRDYWNDPKDRGVRTVRLQDGKAFLMAAVVDDEDAISELKP